jgi:hypothetical protein
MTERINYTKIAESVNYPALDKKLEELRVKGPPKRRTKVADALAPVTDRLLVMHGEGWSYQQLAHELKASGLAVSLSALRAHLTQAGKSRKAKARAATAKG